MASMTGSGGYADYQDRPIKQLIDTEAVVNSDGTFKTVLDITDGAGIIEHMQWVNTLYTGYTRIYVDGEQVYYGSRPIIISMQIINGSWTDRPRGRISFEKSLKVQILKYDNSSARLSIQARVYK